MRLYHSPTTPFGRKVMVLLHETGLMSQVEVITVSGTPLAPGTMPVAQNPLGKIPVLIRSDGMALYDSRVICRYLDQLADAGLYGSGDAMWQVLTLEATADGILDAAVLIAYELRLRPEDKRFPDWVHGQWAKVTRALDMLEQRPLGPLDMGQIALGCALAYLDFRHDARQWRVGRPNLTAFAAEIAVRPAMQVTQPPV